MRWDVPMLVCGMSQAHTYVNLAIVLKDTTQSTQPPHFIVNSIIPAVGGGGILKASCVVIKCLFISWTVVICYTQLVGPS